MRHAAALLAFVSSLFAVNVLGQPLSACLFENGGFERSASPTVLSGAAFHRVDSRAHGGTGYVLLGDTNFSAFGSAYQDVTIPASIDQAYLAFSLNVETDETTLATAYDRLSIQIRNTTGGVLAILATYSNLNRSAGAAYSRKVFSLMPYRGQHVRIYFQAQTDFSLSTAFRIDDVDVSCKGDPPPLEPPDLVVTAAGPLVASAGDALPISVVIVNNGGIVAQSFAANLALPALLKFVSCSAKGGTCSGEGPAASFQQLAPDGLVGFDIVANIPCVAPDGAQLNVIADAPFNEQWPANNSDDVKIIVTNPVAISDVTVDKSVLWPPNHKMIDVVVGYTASAGNCGPVSSTLKVFSNELAKGKKEPDWEIVDAHHVRLRAERDGAGDGRIYTIRITAEDAFGHSSSEEISVTVPK